jgi:hypothetical protein
VETNETGIQVYADVAHYIPTQTQFFWEKVGNIIMQLLIRGNNPVNNQ